MTRCFVLLLTLFLTPAAHAETVAVYRCVGAQGETVFSGMPCSATSMAVEPGAGATDDGHNDWLETCAPSANDLRDRVAAAFDQHDVNLLGGLFLWRGIGDRSAYQHMRELRTLVRQPLAGLAINGDPGWQADSGGYGALPNSTNTWMSITTDNSGASTHDAAGNADDSAMVEQQFGLVERNACVWMTF